VDEGALCLSLCGCDPRASRNPDESYGEEDRHKAPTHPHIHPLSLQTGGGVFCDYLIRLPKFISMDPNIFFRFIANARQ
jgi:hypothetical protein